MTLTQKSEGETVGRLRMRVYRWPGEQFRVYTKSEAPGRRSEK